MTGASLEEIPFPSTETNVIKMAVWEELSLSPETSPRAPHPWHSAFTACSFASPSCYYHPSCMLRFCVSANRCSKIKPHLLDDVLSLLCCLGLFGLQSPKMGLNRCLAYGFKQSYSQSYVCVSLPLKSLSLFPVDNNQVFKQKLFWQGNNIVCTAWEYLGWNTFTLLEFA